MTDKDINIFEKVIDATEKIEVNEAFVFYELFGEHILQLFKLKNGVAPAKPDTLS